MHFSAGLAVGALAALGSVAAQSSSVSSASGSASNSATSAASSGASTTAASSATSSASTAVPSNNPNATCLSLRGSKQCPSFQDAWVNPTNLTQAWPWFSLVNDVDSFDAQFDIYFRDPYRFHATKFNDQLQCNTSAAMNATLQYQRTILCGQFSQISYSAGCNRANRAQPVMVCQDTCLQYAGTESSLVANPQICQANSTLSPAQNATRNRTLRNDYVTCTDWTTLTSTNNATCVLGLENEGNCGWGPEVNNQLCQYCDPSGNQTVSACCFDAKTDLSQCARFGFPGAAAIRPTMSIGTSLLPSQTASSSSSSAASGSTTGAAVGSAADVGSNTGAVTRSGLTGGQLAGIIVGSIIGALLLGALLAWLALSRRKRNNEAAARKNALPGPGAGAVAAGAGGGVYQNSNGTHEGSTEKAGGASAWKHSMDTAHRVSPVSNFKSTGNVSSPSPVSASTGAGVLAGAGAGAGAAAAGLAGAGAAARQSGDERPKSSFSTNTDGRGTTVAMVKDQYSGHEIHPDDTVVAIYPYTASLNDELNLEPDDMVTVVRLYDDGWALGRTQSGQEGAFPMVCVTSSKGDAPRTSEDGGYTSQGGVTSSSMDLDGAVTADEGFTSDARSYRSARA